MSAWDGEVGYDRTDIKHPDRAEALRERADHDRKAARENAAPAPVDRDDWPVHQPEALDAPIPGRHWYAGCEPGGDWDYELGNYTGTGPRVNPATGICAGCGEVACVVCGRANCPDHPGEQPTRVSPFGTWRDE